MRGTGAREAARKPRQDFKIQKSPIFSPLWLSMRSNQRKKVGPFAPLKMGHVASAFRKENEKKRKENHFLKKPKIFSLFLQKNFSSFFLPSTLLFLFFFSTIVASIEAPNSSSFLPQITRKSYFRSFELTSTSWALNFR